MNTATIETLLNAILTRLDRLEHGTISVGGGNTPADDRARARAEVFRGDPGAEVTAPPFAVKDIQRIPAALLDEWEENARRDDWYRRFVGSDIRQLISEVKSLRTSPLVNETLQVRALKDRIAHLEAKLSAHTVVDSLTNATRIIKLEQEVERLEVIRDRARELVQQADADEAEGSVKGLYYVDELNRLKEALLAQ